MRLIDADALIEDLKGSLFYSDAIPFVEEAPTIEAIPVVHGEWIKQKPNPDIMKQFHDMGIGKGMSENSIYWTCSNCGNWGTPTHKYCNECGAKMDSKLN